MRCVLHASLYKQNMFLTLTYDETKEGYHNEFHYADVQKFTKRLRERVRRDHGKIIKVFNVHEYGKNGKKHWHLLVFNYSPDDKVLYTTSKGIPLYTSQTLEKLWSHGFHTIGDVSEASAMYQAQYMEKDFKNGYVTSKKKSSSRHSGLGKEYFLIHYEQILRLGYIPFQGRKEPIPRYFLKLGRKHYSHFYDKTAFFDTKDRKAIFRPFKAGEENEHIAKLYRQFLINREDHIKELEAEFEQVISQYIETKDRPEFELSAENTAYDHNKRKTTEKF